MRRRTEVLPVGVFAQRGFVPYITAWSSERGRPVTLVTRGSGLGYADEVPYDRDRYGILWRRVGISPGKGRPTFGTVHSIRQRRAMQRVLCQVCSDIMKDDPEGVLWLMGTDEYEQDPWPAPIDTPHPPICLPCAELSIRACPFLRTQYTALRVTGYHLSAVYGALHQPGPLGPEPIDVCSVALDDPRTRWMQASQLLTRLTEYRIVDLDAEISTYRRERRRR
jgi:hypothetical protein